MSIIVKKTGKYAACGTLMAGALCVCMMVALSGCAGQVIVNVTNLDNGAGVSVDVTANEPALKVVK